HPVLSSLDPRFRRGDEWGMGWGISLPARFDQLKVQMRLHRRPFAGDDAVDAGVAQRAVGQQLVMAQDTVELGAQALDAAPALVIDEMGAELDRDALIRLESVSQQQ